LELLESLIDVLGTGEIDLVVLNAQENVPLAAEVLRTGSRPCRQRKNSIWLIKCAGLLYP
jgi:hypothetical protein